MNQKQIKQHIGIWIAEEDLPVRANLKVIRKNDPDYGMTDDEIKDRNEFIRCYILRDFEPLLLIPEDDTDDDFVIKNYIESAFNTYDFVQKHSQNKFSGYHYRIKEIMEKVKGLAIMHSCISQREGRENTRRRFNSLVDYEFKDEAIGLSNTLKKHLQWVSQLELLNRLSTLNSHIRKCDEIWNKYAYTE